jgi:hypothetical protein
MEEPETPDGMLAVRILVGIDEDGDAQSCGCDRDWEPDAYGASEWTSKQRILHYIPIPSSIVKEVPLLITSQTRTKAHDVGFGSTRY